MTVYAATIDTCRQIAADLSGIDAQEITPDATFMSLGFDSLFLTQLAAAYSREFGTKVTFRQLIDQTPTITDLAAILPAPKEEAAATVEPPTAPVPAIAPTPDAVAPKVAPEPIQPIAASQPTAPSHIAANVDGMAGVFAEQLRLMQEQLRLLTGTASPQALMPTAPPINAPAPNVEAAATDSVMAEPAAAEPTETVKLPAGFGPGNSNNELSLLPEQEHHLRRLIARFNAKTMGSKEATQADRPYHADPRTAAGFERRWKDLVYPLVISRSDGAHIWDVDSNKYIDLLNGFGPNFFGHGASFVKDALRAQLDDGFELGPQTPRAGEAAKLLCELTGMDRASWVNTGSEAVQAAIRIARTVTSKNKIVLFSGSYHGNFDEVLVRRTGKGIGRTLPMAPGIPFESVGNVIVLEYGDDSALDIIREHADDIAAVLVEPIQSRRPEFQPREFLHQLRELTRDEEIVLVFDEVITGFRTGPGGAQANFGIKADLATYGKVLGGGMPIGAVAGRKGVMDTFDGGFWQYGDDSIPTAGVTFFAGTFVRHPLAIAAAHASLSFLKANGPSLQTENNRKAARLVDGMNDLFAAHEIPFEYARFGSQMFLRTGEGGELASLFFYHLRDRGVHILEGFPSYMTIAHTDDDVDHVLEATADSLAEMLHDNMFAGDKVAGWQRTFTPTPAQTEIWVATQLDPQAALAFNESDTFIFEAVDVPRLERAIDQCLNETEAFKTTFDADGSTARVRDDMRIELAYIDACGLSPQQQEETRAELCRREALQPFDIENRPLARATIIREAEDKAVFVLYAHHIAFDGWSAETLLDNIAAAYRGDAADQTVPFSIYAAETSKKNDIEWWTQMLGDHPPALLYWRGAPQGQAGHTGAQTRSMPMDQSVAAGIKRLSASLSVSPSSLILSAYTLVLAEQTGQGSLIVGLPVAGQVMHDIEAMGCGVQLLPLMMNLHPDTTFVDFAQDNQSLIADAAEHPSVSLGTLARATHARTELGRPALVQAVFNYRAGFTGVDMEGTKVTAMENPRHHLFQELFLNVTDNGDGLVYDAEHRTSVLSTHRVDVILRRVTEILAKVMEKPEKTLAELVQDSTSTHQEAAVGK